MISVKPHKNSEREQLLLYFIDKEPREFERLDCPGRSLLWGSVVPETVLVAVSLPLDARKPSGLALLGRK